MIDKDKNIGLPMRFQLTETGGFQLKGGTDKVDDNVGMLMCFIGWFRFYGQDFIINPYRFFQNTTSYLFQYKNIFRMEVLEVGFNHLPNAEFLAVDIPISYENRKETAVYIQFKYNLKSVEEGTVNTIKKILL